MKRIIKIKQIIILSLFVTLMNNAEAQTNFIFGKQFGSDNDGVAYNPVTDQYGNVYISGDTKGSFAGNNVGKSDGFVTKFDSTGNIIWTKQFGTSEDDIINWLAIDSKDNLYVTGYTNGVLNKKNFGNEDILVAKFDTTGTIVWQKQYGSDSTDVGNKIYLDIQGNIYIAGATKGLMGNTSFGKTDCVILKLDNSGNLIWTNQFGSNEQDECIGITGDIASNIYVCGYTTGDLAAKYKGKGDAFIGKFTDNGEQVKLFQIATEELEILTNIIVDNKNNIYTGGWTSGNYGSKHQGKGDSFLLKINENMETIWSHQFGTSEGDGINGIALSEEIPDDIVISGCQNWPNSCQSFIRVYKKDGTLISVNNFVAHGTNGGTCGKGLCIDNKGNIYHTGNTGGNLFKSIDKAEGHDIFLIKLGLDQSRIN